MAIPRAQALPATRGWCTPPAFWRRRPSPSPACSSSGRAGQVRQKVQASGHSPAASHDRGTAGVSGARSVWTRTGERAPAPWEFALAAGPEPRFASTAAPHRLPPRPHHPLAQSAMAQQGPVAGRRRHASSSCSGCRALEQAVRWPQSTCNSGHLPSGSPGPRKRRTRERN